jgi:hypothetical protein
VIFKRDLAEKIVAGEKTATRRVMSDNPRSPWFEGGCKYKVGQVFAVQPGRGVNRLAEATVTKVFAQPLGRMTEADAVAEGFRADATASAIYRFDDAWERINGEYFPDEIVWVVEFELVAATSQRAA